MKKIVIIGLSTVFSYFFSIYLKEAYQFIDVLIIPYLAIISGVIIASVSTILGNINSLFALLKMKEQSCSEDKKQSVNQIIVSVEGHLDNVIIEIKQNSVFIILVCLVVIILRLCNSIDLPWITFPFSNYYISKEILLKVFAIDLTILSTIAMLDSLFCFFTINDHFKALR
jgi:hypothetical protein